MLKNSYEMFILFQSAVCLLLMERELSDQAGGKKVDLRTPQDLSRYFRDEVLAAAAYSSSIASQIRAVIRASSRAR